MGHTGENASRCLFLECSLCICRYRHVTTSHMIDKHKVSMCCHLGQSLWPPRPNPPCNRLCTTLKLLEKEYATFGSQSLGQLHPAPLPHSLADLWFRPLPPTGLSIFVHPDGAHACRLPRASAGSPSCRTSFVPGKPALPTRALLVGRSLPWALLALPGSGVCGCPTPVGPPRPHHSAPPRMGGVILSKVGGRGPLRETETEYRNRQ